MSEPSNGITAEVIRNIMPPYHLSPDLLEDTLATLPAPPPNATPAWRLARLTRLIEEIAAPKPANAEQARIAAEIVIVRGLARALIHRAHTADQTTEQKCNLARAATGLQKTALSLARSLVRLQAMPVAFFGTVVQDEVDLLALNATWHAQPPPANTPPPPPPPRAATPPPSEATPRPLPSADRPDATPPTADTARLPVEAPTPPPATITTAEPPTTPAGHAETTTTPDQNSDTTPEWSFTKIDEGPGWSREVLRHRSSQPAGNGSAPGTPT